MDELRVKVGEKGRLVLPSALREKLGIRIGDVVNLRVEDNEMRIATLQSRLRQAQERLQKYATPGRLMSDELIAERREAAKLE